MGGRYSTETDETGVVTVFKGDRAVGQIVPRAGRYTVHRMAGDGRRATGFMTTVDSVQAGTEVLMGVFGL